MYNGRCLSDPIEMKMYDRPLRFRSMIFAVQLQLTWEWQLEG